jgi:NAD(P)H dehydrogenase (quinone)
MTQEELVATLGSVLGKEVLVQQVNDSVYAEIMKGEGVPDFVVPVLVEIQKAIRYGQLDIESDDFGGLLGRPATSIEVALSQIVRELSQL